MQCPDASCAITLPAAPARAHGARVSGARARLSIRSAQRWLALGTMALLSLLIGWAIASVGATGGAGGRSTVHAAAAGRAAAVGLPSAADDAVSATLGASIPAYAISPLHAGFQAAGPAQHLQVRFYRSHVSLSAGAVHVGLGLRALGFGDSLVAVGAASPRAAANRVIYPHSGLSEWYLNGPLGLEQGFTLARSPARLASGPLTLSLALSTNARGRLAPGGRSITFARAGADTLSYGGLTATDATGRLLHSWLELRGGRVLLRLDARGARYPLRIDPMFAQREGLGVAGESGEGQLGISVALSADGSTALVGAPRDNNGQGAAWVFTRSGAGWSQQGPKLTVGAEGGSQGGEEQCAEEAGEEPGECAFGASVALSADGSTALVGDPSAASRRGTAWVFTRSGSSWGESAMLTGDQASGGGRFGTSVALSADGATALIGDPSASEQEGRAWVFTRSGSGWATEGEPLADPSAARLDFFGRSVALSGDGLTALVGAPGASEGVGAAWVFARSGSTWTQQGARLTGGEEGGEGRFGFSVALSADGTTALIGGRHDGEGVGAAWVFAPSGSAWIQQGSKLTAAGESGPGSFGWSVALSADGTTALIGAPHENHYLGVARVFTRAGSVWAEQPEQLVGTATSGTFAYSVALSGNGIALVGVPRESHKAGAVWAFSTPSTPPPPPPTVIQVTPKQGSVAGGTKVTIEGSGFLPGASVTIGTAAVSVNVLSETEITAVTAATSPGSDEVVVTDSNGSSTGGPLYTYLAPQVAATPASSTTGEGEHPRTPIAGSGVLASETVAFPPPQLAVSGNLTPVSGDVLVKLPGSRTFVALTGIRQVPFGTIVDARKGRVSVTTVGPHGALQTLIFFNGEFTLTQSRDGILVATLFGGDFSVCPTARERSHLARASSKHASRKHVVRKLWAEGHGSATTKGNYAAGAVLGTRWLTEDLCDGTLIHVATDRVRVTNFVNHHHLTVKAGHSYLAKAP
jgi:hypothetical protein